MKIITEKEQLPSGENALKVMRKTYNYQEQFGEFTKSNLIKDSVIYEYDRFGRIVHFINYNISYYFDEKDKPLKNSPIDVNIQYKYDKNGVLVEEYDSLKNYPKSKYKCDNSGKVVIKYEYNSDGREETKITYQYDAMGRIIKKNYDGISYSYKYDVKNNIEEEKSSTIFSVKVVLSYKYLFENQIEHKAISYDNNGQVLYRYNGGYKHFVFENRNNKNKNWISRITYSVVDTFFSSTDTAYLIFLVIGIVGYFSAPNVANYVVHAGGGNTILQRVNTIVSNTSSTAGSIAMTGGGMVADTLGDGARGLWQSFSGAGNGDYFPDKDKSGSNYQRNRLSGKS